MNNSFIIFFIFCLLILILCFFCKNIEHSTRKNFDEIKKKWINVENDKIALDWLNTISDYDSNNLCFIFTIGTIILLVIIQLLIFNALNIKIENYFKFLGIEIFSFFLIIYLILSKMIDYFRWHIMCINFGCTSIHIS
tara:strand:+ start:99 stop:512 length:414 start_codon:yes stop_codon:yes gene_type:complete